MQTCLQEPAVTTVGAARHERDETPSSNLRQNQQIHRHWQRVCVALEPRKQSEPNPAVRVRLCSASSPPHPILDGGALAS